MPADPRRRKTSGSKARKSASGKRPGTGAAQPAAQTLRERQKHRQRRYLLVGGALVFAVGAAVPLLQDNSDDPQTVATDPPQTVAPPPAETTEVLGPVAPETTAPATTAAETTAPETTAAATTVPDTALGFGATGDEVTALQTRLSELGFVGPVDGRFGAPTRDAVWAFEKLVMHVPPSQVTGRVTDEMWQQMQPPLVITPRRLFASGQATQNHTEVYLPEQVVAFYVNDVPTLITHMSSGTSQEWEGEVTIDPGEVGNDAGTAAVTRVEHGISTTPGGVFTYLRLADGVRNTGLGGMWSPAFFNSGIAIHGALSVPTEPASHGSVRIPMQFAATFHQLIAVGDQVFVWDGFQEPEAYGAQPPIANYIVDVSATTEPTVPTSVIVAPGVELSAPTTAAPSA